MADSNNSNHIEPSENNTIEEFCFVMMPFGGRRGTYYQEIYKPAIEAVGLSAVRADDLFRPRAIMDEVWELTQQSSIILADLTGRNPNVLYELGLAHALAKPAVLVTETIDDVPFDLTALRVITYEKDDPKWGEKLQNEIAQALKEVLVEPLKAIPVTFLKVDKNIEVKSISSIEKTLLELRQEIDFLKTKIQTRSYEGKLSNHQNLLKEYLVRNYPPGFFHNEEYIDITTVVKWLRNGVPEEVIRDFLKKYGWADDVITKILIRATPYLEESSDLREQTPSDE